jgi:hypothetical protein
MKELAYTESGSIWIPEKFWDQSELPQNAKIVPLRGMKYTAAVTIDGECVGWTVVAS